MCIVDTRWIQTFTKLHRLATCMNENIAVDTVYIVDTGMGMVDTSMFRVDTGMIIVDTGMCIWQIYTGKHSGYRRVYKVEMRMCSTIAYMYSKMHVHCTVYNNQNPAVYSISTMDDKSKIYQNLFVEDVFIMLPK